MRAHPFTIRRLLYCILTEQLQPGRHYDWNRKDKS